MKKLLIFFMLMSSICYSHEYIGKSGGENGNSIRQGSGIEEVKD